MAIGFGIASRNWWRAQFSGGIVPSFALNFATIATDFTFTRNSFATRVNENGLIETVSNNVPRIDYSSGEGAFLLEPASTNLYLNSETLSTQDVTTSASTYTISFRGTGSVSLSGSGSGTLVGTGTMDLVSLTFTATAGTLTSTVSGSVKYSNLENLGYATSWIPTDGTTVTRAQELCVDATPTINSEEGVFYVETSALVNGGANRYVSISDGSSSNRLQILYSLNVNRLTVGGVNNGVGLTSINYNSFDQTVNHKIAVAYSASGFKVFVDGVSIGSDLSNASFPIGSLTDLDFSIWNSISAPFYGNTKDLKIYDKLLTDEQLEDLTAPPPPPAPLFLDEYPNASVAYSLRDLANASVGNPVVRVRRLSDNAEQDFTSEEITDGTLTTFSGASDGFVTTWYDQSGNSNNAGQATAINQPKLVDSGVLQLDNLNPAINFSLGGSNSFTLNNRILDVQSVFQVLNAQPSTGNYKQFILGDSSNFDYHSGLGELLISSQWASGLVIDGKHYINQQQYDFTSTNKPTNQSVLSLIAETPSTKVSQLTKDRGGNSSWEGKMQEIILYPTDESANRSGIEKNINTKYNIYPENTAISGLLFDYPNASAAYSLRQLTTFNTGFKPIIVKVRRSSDNTEQTFTATEITDGTLTTFTGANDGFVVTWYDQSNNMGWAKQQTATNQPKIVSSGVVELENGKPTLKFDGTDKLISNDLNVNSQPNSYFIAFKLISGENIFDGSGNRNALYQYLGLYYMYANAQAVTSFSTTSSMVLSANLFNGSNSFMSLNGVLQTGLNVGADYQRGLVIGGNGTNNINGTVSEFIMYPTDQSANRLGIETNINTEYTIY